MFDGVFYFQVILIEFQKIKNAKLQAKATSATSQKGW